MRMAMKLMPANCMKGSSSQSSWPAKAGHPVNTIRTITLRLCLLGHPLSRMMTTRATGRSPQLPYRGPLDLHVLQLARYRHRIFREPRQALFRQIGAARIADQYPCADGGTAFKKSERTGRRVALVE